MRRQRSAAGWEGRLAWQGRQQQRQANIVGGGGAHRALQQLAAALLGQRRNSCVDISQWIVHLEEGSHKPHHPSATGCLLMGGADLRVWNVRLQTRCGSWNAAGPSRQVQAISTACSGCRRGAADYTAMHTI